MRNVAACALPAPHGATGGAANGRAADTATADLLFEIGCEELPAADVPKGLEQLAKEAREALAEARLAPQSLRTVGTPRRLVLHATGVPLRQPEKREWVRGPAERAAFDAEGQPTKAAQGFARGQGVPVEALEVRDHGGGRYVFAEVVEAGRPAGDVLQAVLGSLVGRLGFPKTMRWGDSDFRFSRPIRWLLALIGEDVIQVEVDGLKAGRETYGHRFLAPGPFSIANPEDYFRKLDAAYVVVDPAERRQLVQTGVQAVAQAAGGRARVPAQLVAEVTNLVEFPTPFVGTFAEAHLDLPEEVLVTTMRVNQRYFPVEGADGKLLNRFAAVRNGDRQGLATVIAGNEQVLRARLADARFFWDDDRKRTLESRVANLDTITYLPELGTLLDKTRRVETLVSVVADALGADDADRQAATRAAHLAKADQLTSMVYEFTELQGVMGSHYARLDGEPEAVARAIGEQYRPHGAGDALPETAAGRILALADKLDDLAAGFLTNREPKGSQDPFGLRRQAIGLLRILKPLPMGVEMDDLLRAAVREALTDMDDVARKPGPGGTVESDVDDVLAAVAPFMAGRLRAQMLEAGLRPDVVEAVLARGASDAALAWWRANALQSALQRPDLEDIVVAFRRAANLAQKAMDADAPSGAVAPTANLQPVPTAAEYEDTEERLLAEALEAAQKQVHAALQVPDGKAFFDAIAGLRPAVDRFLENVLAMDPDQEVRKRRLALLDRVARLANRVADLGKVALTADAA